MRVVRVLLPVTVLAIGIAGWALIVWIYDIPPYLLPGPSDVLWTLIGDWGVLWHSLLVTLRTTLEGFIAAAIGGIALALMFNQSKWLEYSLFPYAVILQVTPVIAIAPLLLVYLPQQTAVLVCAWIVGFFPVLSNTTLGLNSVDRNLAGPFPALRRVAIADLAIPEIAGGVAVHSRWIADRRRLVADRRGRGRARRRHCRGRFRTGLPNRRIRQSAQHSPNVRRAAVALGRRDCHLCAAGANLAPGVAALA